MKRSIWRDSFLGQNDIKISDLILAENKGVTLVELLVVVVIVGILAAIAIPNFLGLLAQQQVKTGFEQVQGSLKEAQRQAIRRGQRCRIKIEAININFQKRYKISTVSEPGWDYTGCLLSDRLLSSGLAVKTTNSFAGNPPKITFSHKGNTTQSGTIIVYSPNNQYYKKCMTISNGLGIMREGNYDKDINLPINGNQNCKSI